MGDCLIGFGSNMGDSRAIYQAVQDSFAQAPEIDRCVPSRLKKTTPVGGQSQDLYLNGALRIESQLDPVQLHQYLKIFKSVKDFLN